MVNKSIKITRNTLADFDRCRINFILNLLQFVFILLHLKKNMPLMVKWGPAWLAVIIFLSYL